MTYETLKWLLWKEENNSSHNSVQMFSPDPIKLRLWFPGWTLHHLSSKSGSSNKRKTKKKKLFWGVLQYQSFCQATKPFHLLHFISSIISYFHICAVAAIVDSWINTNTEQDHTFIDDLLLNCSTNTAAPRWCRWRIGVLQSWWRWWVGLGESRFSRLVWVSFMISIPVCLLVQWRGAIHFDKCSV